eukprot:30718-Pelagococcus_subviridis.AAC.3
MQHIVAISSLTPYLSLATSVLESIGSSGNSAIRRPSFVSSPRSFSAPNAYSCSSALRSVSAGGASMKSKCIRSLIPSDLSMSTTFPRSGVERRRGVSGLKARDERRDAPGEKVLKDRRSPRRRGRTGTSFVLKRPRRVQPETLPRRRPPGSSSALQRARLRRRRDHERLHPGPWVVALLLAEPRVDDVLDAVDRERRLRDVRGEHHLSAALRRRVEDLRLQIRRQRRVDGRDDELGDLASHGPHPVPDHLLRGLDLFLAGEKHQDVPRRLRDVNLQHRDHRGVEVVRLRLPRVQDVHRVPPTGNAEDGREVKVLAELFRVQRRGGDEELNLRPEPRDVLHQSEQHVRVQRALVRFVHHHHAVRREVGLAQELAE